MTHKDHMSAEVRAELLVKELSQDGVDFLREADAEERIVSAIKAAENEALERAAAEIEGIAERIANAKGRGKSRFGATLQEFYGFPLVAAAIGELSHHIRSLKHKDDP